MLVFRGVHITIICIYIFAFSKMFELRFVHAGGYGFLKSHRQLGRKQLRLILTDHFFRLDMTTACRDL